MRIYQRTFIETAKNNNIDYTDLYDPITNINISICHLFNLYKKIKNENISYRNKVNIILFEFEFGEDNFLSLFNTIKSNLDLNVVDIIDELYKYNKDKNVINSIMFVKDTLSNYYKFTKEDFHSKISNLELVIKDKILMDIYKYNKLFNKNIKLCE